MLRRVSVSLSLRWLLFERIVDTPKEVSVSGSPLLLFAHIQSCFIAIMIKPTQNNQTKWYAYLLFIPAGIIGAFVANIFANFGFASVDPEIAYSIDYMFFDFGENYIFAPIFLFFKTFACTLAFLYIGGNTIGYEPLRKVSFTLPTITMIMIFLSYVAKFVIDHKEYNFGLHEFSFITIVVVATVLSVVMYYGSALHKWKQLNSKNVSEDSI